MPIYDINGSNIQSVYGISGNRIPQAYDIDGNELMSVSLVVMTYNYQWCNGRNNLEYQSSIIEEYNPDIIGLQEAGNGRNREFPSIAQQALVDHPYKYMTNYYNYNAIASKLQLTDVSEVIYTYENDEKWTYQKCYLNVGGKTVAWYNTHLTWKSGETQARASQAQELLADVETEDYVIITGDFNMFGSDVSSDEYIGIGKPFVDAGYNMVNWAGSDGFVKTWTDADSATSLNEFRYACDNIIVSPNISIDSVVFDTTKLSMGSGTLDHVPVIAHLTIGGDS